MTPVFVLITTRDGPVYLAGARIMSIHAPTGLVHDHGSVTLDDGRTFAFADDDGAARLLRDLQQEHLGRTRMAIQDLERAARDPGDWQS